jgi:hypothetical protein
MGFGDWVRSGYRESVAAFSFPASVIRIRSVGRDAREVEIRRQQPHTAALARAALAAGFPYMVPAIVVIGPAEELKVGPPPPVLSGVPWIPFNPVGSTDAAVNAAGGPVDPKPGSRSKTR